MNADADAGAEDEREKVCDEESEDNLLVPGGRPLLPAALLVGGGLELGVGVWRRGGKVPVWRGKDGGEGVPVEREGLRLRAGGAQDRAAAGHPGGHAVLRLPQHRHQVRVAAEGDGRHGVHPVRRGLTHLALSVTNQ